jgi:hypothetical protein
MDKLQRELVEDTIIALNNNESTAVSEAQDILKYASSDDFKNRLVDELYDLDKAMDDHIRRAECQI